MEDEFHEFEKSSKTEYSELEKKCNEAALGDKSHAIQSDQLNFQIKSLSEKNEQLEKQIQILVNEHKNEVKDLKDAQQLLLDDMKKNNKQLLEETKSHYESMLEDVESRRKKALNEGETQNARVHERMDEIDELNTIISS